MFTRPTKICPAAACRSSTARPCTLVLIPSPRALGNEASAGVHSRSPVRSSPRLRSRMGRARFGFFPELRTPQLPATHVRAGTGLEHWPGAIAPTSSALQSASSLTTCDLVSHVLGPVIAHEKPQRPSLSRSAVTVSSLRENYRRPNDTVLTPSPAGTTSQQRSTLPASRQGHDLSSGLRELPGDGQCSPAGGYRPESAATAGSLALIRDGPLRVEAQALMRSRPAGR